MQISLEDSFMIAKVAHNGHATSNSLLYRGVFKMIIMCSGYVCHWIYFQNILQYYETKAIECRLISNTTATCPVVMHCFTQQINAN